MDAVVVLDFGGQTTQLIARRIRDFGVYSEILPGNVDLGAVIQSGHSHGLQDLEIRGIILSGSPHSAKDLSNPGFHSSVLHLGLPILGICYGFHRLILEDGGEIKTYPQREFGRSRVVRGHFDEILSEKDDLILHDIPDSFETWMSHSDSVEKIGRNYRIIARSENNIPAVASHSRSPFWGVQFHPESSHCEYGAKILENFVCLICHAKKEWSLDFYMENQTKELKTTVGNRNVLLLISGGVDSMVTAALLLRCLKREQIWLMYIDTGFMRLDEGLEVKRNLEKFGAENLLLIDAGEEFVDAISGIQDTEKKRQIIGDTFIKVQQKKISQHIPEGYLLAQGTLYTDLIESGQGVGKMAHAIKTHHNVNSPLVLEKRQTGNLLEPLSGLYKDEVRQLGGLLDMDEEIIRRHPFPGPGLAIRIISNVTWEKLNILRRADAIFINELRERGLYNQIWQAFCVLLPVRSVGVTGDSRSYGYVMALRAITSRDGMSADVFRFPDSHLEEISACITNRVKEIGRIVYDVSSKPPATIEWE